MADLSQLTLKNTQTGDTELFDLKDNTARGTAMSALEAAQNLQQIANSDPSESALAAAQAASQAVESIQTMVDSIPADYTSLSQSVDNLQSVNRSGQNFELIAAYARNSVSDENLGMVDNAYRIQSIAYDSDSGKLWVGCSTSGDSLGYLIRINASVTKSGQIVPAVNTLAYNWTNKNWEKVIETNMGHLNSMCYHPIQKKIYAVSGGTSIDDPYASNVPANRVFLFDPSTETYEYHDVGSTNLSGVAYYNGNIYITDMSRLHILDTTTWTLSSPLFSITKGVVANAYSDLQSDNSSTDTKIGWTVSNQSIYVDTARGVLYKTHVLNTGGQASEVASSVYDIDTHALIDICRVNLGVRQEYESSCFLGDSLVSVTDGKFPSLYVSHRLYGKNDTIKIPWHLSSGYNLNNCTMPGYYYTNSASETNSLVNCPITNISIGLSVFPVGGTALMQLVYTIIPTDGVTVSSVHSKFGVWARVVGTSEIGMWYNAFVFGANRTVYSMYEQLHASQPFRFKIGVSKDIYDSLSPDNEVVVHASTFASSSIIPVSQDSLTPLYVGLSSLTEYNYTCSAASSLRYRAYGFDRDGNLLGNTSYRAIGASNSKFSLDFSTAFPSGKCAYVRLLVNLYKSGTWTNTDQNLIDDLENGAMSVYTNSMTASGLLWNQMMISTFNTHETVTTQ